MRIKPIPLKIESTRLKKGFTMNELSRIAKVSKNTITKLEAQEDYYPNANIAKKICVALCVEFDELFSIE